MTEAFFDWGRWVAQCPNCTNALELTPGQTTFTCQSSSGIGTCGATAAVVWPGNKTDIEVDRIGRPPQHRHWKPGDAL